MEYKKHLPSIAALVIGGTISYFAYDIFVSKTLEDITVTSIGKTEIYFLQEGQIASVCSPLIYVDQFNDCLRGYDIIPEDLKVGDKIKSISYRSLLFGNCKILTDIVRK